MLHIVFQTLCIFFLGSFSQLHALTHSSYSYESAVVFNNSLENSSQGAFHYAAAFIQEPSTGSGHKLFLAIAEIEVEEDEEDFSASKLSIEDAGYPVYNLYPGFLFHSTESITDRLPYCKHYSYFAFDRYLKILVIRI